MISIIFYFLSYNNTDVQVTKLQFGYREVRLFLIFFQKIKQIGEILIECIK